MKYLLFYIQCLYSKRILQSARQFMSQLLIPQIENKWKLPILTYMVQWTHEWKKSVTGFLSELFDVSPKNFMWKLANRNKLPEGGLERLLLVSYKWMILVMRNIGVSINYRSSQMMIVIRNLTKFFKYKKVLCMLFCAVNDNQILKHYVSSDNTTLPFKKIL